MRHADDLGLDEYRAAIAVSRIVLGPTMRIQAPPNLVDSTVGSTECRSLLDAGVDDWGGVSPLTPDHVNPERPWPSIERLRAVTAEAGFELAPRLTVHPHHVRQRTPWVDPRLDAHLDALALPDGLARIGVRPVGLPWQEPDATLEGTGRTDLHATIDTAGPHAGPPRRLRQRLRRLGRGRRGRRAGDRGRSNTGSVRPVHDEGTPHCGPPRPTRPASATTRRWR